MVICKYFIKFLIRRRNPILNFKIGQIILSLFITLYFPPTARFDAFFVDELMGAFTKCVIEIKIEISG